MAPQYSKLPVWHVAAPVARRRPSTALIVGGILAVVGLLATVLYHPVSKSIGQLAYSACRAREFTHSYNVSEHFEFQDLSPAADAPWQDLFTANGGYLFRQMPSPDGEDEIRVYGISMFHQLHCVSMLRATLQAMNATIHGETLPETHHHDLRDHHYLHCLDYLRQTILCNADDTLEAPKRDAKDPLHDIVAGAGPRMCRNSERLYDMARLAGPSVQLRRKVAAEGESWPEPEGVEWPEPRS